MVKLTHQLTGNVQQSANAPQVARFTIEPHGSILINTGVNGVSSASVGQDLTGSRNLSGFYSRLQVRHA